MANLIHCTTSYEYGVLLPTPKPYQNSAIALAGSANEYYQNRPLQNISYTAFNAPIQIEVQGVEKISFGYNGMEKRSISYYGGINDKLTRPYRKYYSADGTMEIKYTVATGAVEIITFIGGDAYSAPAILKSDGTSQNYYYMHRDYQGTIVALSNDSGSIVEKRQFDVWGNIIKIQDGSNVALGALTILNRGYTGHEHLQSVGLIHMNARLYDSRLHRFLSPDKYL